MSQSIPVNGFEWDKIFKFTEDFVKKNIMIVVILDIF